MIPPTQCCRWQHHVFRVALQPKDRPCKPQDYHWIRNSMIRLEVFGGGMTWVAGPKWLAEDVIEPPIIHCKVWNLQTYESCWTFLNIDTSIHQYMFPVV